MIIFGSDQEVAGLMRAVKRMNATGKFNWIGSDGWSARALVSDGKGNRYYDGMNAYFSMQDCCRIFTTILHQIRYKFVKFFPT